MTALEYLKNLHEICHFRSTSRPGTRASTSDLRRIIDEGGLHLNGERIGAQDDIPYPLKSAVLFPKRRRTTLW